MAIIESLILKRNLQIVSWLFCFLQAVVETKKMEKSRKPATKPLLTLDSTRGFYYQEKSKASLNATQQNNWHVVSRKNDWKTVYPGK